MTDQACSALVDRLYHRADSAAGEFGHGVTELFAVLTH